MSWYSPPTDLSYTVRSAVHTCVWAGSWRRRLSRHVVENVISLTVLCLLFINLFHSKIIFCYNEYNFLNGIWFCMSICLFLNPYIFNDYLSFISFDIPMVGFYSYGCIWGYRVFLELYKSLILYMFLLYITNLYQLVIFIIAFVIVCWVIFEFLLCIFPFLVFSLLLLYLFI